MVRVMSNTTQWGSEVCTSTIMDTVAQIGGVISTLVWFALWINNRR
jgi:hypothetical protein